MLSTTFGNEEIQQMTALCSQSFVHDRERERQRNRDRICFWALAMENKGEVTTTLQTSVQNQSQK